MTFFFFWEGVVVGGGGVVYTKNHTASLSGSHSCSDWISRSDYYTLTPKRGGGGYCRSCMFVLLSAHRTQELYIDSGSFLPLPRRLCFRLGLSVRLFVCFFVCEQDNSKTYGRILIKFSGYIRNGKRKKWFWEWFGSLSWSSGSMKFNF